MSLHTVIYVPVDVRIVNYRNEMKIQFHPDTKNFEMDSTRTPINYFSIADSKSTGLIRESDLLSGGFFGCLFSDFLQVLKKWNRKRTSERGLQYNNRSFLQSINLPNLDWLRGVIHE